MTEEAELRASICRQPEQDLPRLAYADWLEEEAGEVERAEHIRNQIRLAASNPWDAWAVHQPDDHASAARWEDELPNVDGWALEWHPERCFRRGFPWSLVIRDLPYFLERAPYLFSAAPIGELHLPTAPIGQWRDFARCPWLPQIESIHFYGTATAIEPVLVLMNAANALRIRELVFYVASRPGMPELLRQLFLSELGRGLERLHLLIGPQAPDELIDVLINASGLSLTDFALHKTGLMIEHLSALSRSQLFQQLERFEMLDVPLGFQLLSVFESTPAKLKDLSIRRSGFDPGLLDMATAQGWLDKLNRLDFSLNPSRKQVTLGSRFVTHEFAELRSIRLAHNGLGNQVADSLADASYLPLINELDLRDNPIDREAAAKLRSTMRNDSVLRVTT